MSMRHRAGKLSIAMGVGAVWGMVWMLVAGVIFMLATGLVITLPVKLGGAAGLLAGAGAMLLPGGSAGSRRLLAAGAPFLLCLVGSGPGFPFGLGPDEALPAQGGLVLLVTGLVSWSIRETLQDLPEALLAGRERIYVTWFLRAFAAHPGAIDDATVEEYARAYAQPGAMRAALAYYRAIPRDIAENERAIAAGKLEMPVLALGGGESFGRRELALESLRRVANDVHGGVVAGCGHFIPEEKPEELAAQLLAFFG